MQDAEIILTKNRVLQAVKDAMEALGADQQAFIRHAGMGNGIFSIAPKVSRGENYKGLPWLVLDYPRVSGADGLYFIRSFFWWGRFFSSTLHLSGSYARAAVPALSAAWSELSDVVTGVGDDSWVHDLNGEDYRPVHNWKAEEFAVFLERRETIKLARKCALVNWEKADEFWMENWQFWLEISDQLPRR